MKRIITLLLIILLIPVNGTHAAARENVTTDTKWVMVGDSYSVMPLGKTEKTWPVRLKKKPDNRGCRFLAAVSIFLEVI